MASAISPYKRSVFFLAFTFLTVFIFSYRPLWIKRVGSVDDSDSIPFSGEIVKRGPLGILEMVASLYDVQVEGIFPKAWQAERLNGATPKPPPFCPIMFNDKYKLIYLKSPKTAGSTIMSYFGNCAGNRATDRCFENFQIANSSQVQHLLDVWHDYYVFSFTRNVLLRAISQFQYLTSFMHGDCSVSWDEFCKDPYILGDVCASKSCCIQSGVHQYLHVIPQTNCLLTTTQELAMDYLGRVEHFDDDFAALVNILNTRSNVPSLPNALPDKKNYNESPCQANRKLLYNVTNTADNPCDKMDFFRNSHAHCYTRITSFFAEDIDQLVA